MKRVIRTVGVLVLVGLSCNSLTAQELTLTGPGPAVRPPFVENQSQEGFRTRSNADEGRDLTPRERRMQIAALKAAQRRARIANAKSIGVDPSRPTVSAVPTMSGSSNPATVLRYGYPGAIYSVPIYR
jgi:hypothetical protein